MRPQLAPFGACGLGLLLPVLLLGLWQVNLVTALFAGAGSISSSSDAASEADDSANMPLLFTVQPQVHAVLTNHTAIYLHCAAAFTAPPSAHNAIASTEAAAAADDQPPIAYSWLRNDRPLVGPSAHYEAIDGNRTLRLTNAKIASGRFRCVAEDQLYGTGAIVSRASHVQQAVFKLQSEAGNETSAQSGGSALIECPFLSVPPANVTWWLVADHNESSSVNDTRIAEDNAMSNGRFYQLSNGNLLIVDTIAADARPYRCEAHNSFAALKPHRSHTTRLRIIHTAPEELAATRAVVLLPALQSATTTIGWGDALRLACAPRNAAASAVHWTRLPPTDDEAEATGGVLAMSGAVWQIRNATGATAAGQYNCSTAYEWQTFTVIVATDPQLLVAPPTLVVAKVGAFKRFNCSATGSPAPTVRWYRDGHAVRNTSVLRVLASNDLLLRTFDASHQGLYQCVVETVPGRELSATVQLRLTRTAEVSLRPLRNVVCYPHNATYYLIGYSSATPISELLVYQVNDRVGEEWMTLSSTYARPPPMVAGMYAFNTHWRPYRAFRVIARGLQKYAERGSNDYYDLSPMSAEVWCAKQGVQLNAIVHDNGDDTFVWWSDEDLPAVPHLRLHVQLADTELAANISAVCSSTMLATLGTWAPDNAQQTIWPDVAGALQSVAIECHPALTANESIAILTIPGNVTGLLFRGVRRLSLRLIVPVWHDQHELPLNYTHLQWQHIPAMRSSFEAVASLDRAIIRASNPLLSCIRVCLHRVQLAECQQLDRPFVLTHLNASTEYTALVLECGRGHRLLKQLQLRTTAPLIPLPIVELRVECSSTSCSLHWFGPTDSPVAVHHYLLEWRFFGYEYVKEVQQFHAKANDSVQPIGFVLPPPASRYRVPSITIRAISADGHASIPVYYNAEFEDPDSETLQQRSLLECFAIVFSALICVFMFAAVIYFVTTRHLRKRRQAGGADWPSSGGEMATAAATGHNGHNGATAIMTVKTTAAGVPRPEDAHELQMLIVIRPPTPDGSVLSNDDGGGGRAEDGDDGDCPIAVTSDNEGETTEQPVAVSAATDGQPLFTSTPAKSNGQRQPGAPSTLLLNGGSDSTGSPSPKPLSPNNNVLEMLQTADHAPQSADCHLDDNSRRPLFADEDTCETTTGSIEQAATFEETHRQPLAQQMQQCHLQQQPASASTNKGSLLGWSYQRPLVGPNG